MAIETERRFLVDRAAWEPSDPGTRLRQGYLSTEPERTIRVRTDGLRAHLTIKGLRSGGVASEFEYEIPTADAEILLGELTVGTEVDKTRHRLVVGGKVWEVDVFHGANEGLVIAEVELDSEDEPVELPDWVGEEITTDYRFSNSILSERPFSTW